MRERRVYSRGAGRLTMLSGGEFGAGMIMKTFLVSCAIAVFIYGCTAGDETVIRTIRSNKDLTSDIDRLNAGLSSLRLRVEVIEDALRELEEIDRVKSDIRRHENALQVLGQSVVELRGDDAR